MGPDDLGGRTDATLLGMGDVLGVRASLRALQDMDARMNSSLTLSRRKALMLALGSLSLPGVAWSASLSLSILRSLDVPDGTQPMAVPVRGRAGSWWGTTSYQGAGGLGTIYRIDATGQCEVMHAFRGEVDGAKPHAALAAGPGGVFYGVTLQGGSAAYGVAFVFDPASGLRVLHHFGASYQDAKSPRQALQWGPDGRLYGVSFGGGAFDRGSVFAIAPDGAYTRLVDLDGHLGRIDSDLVLGPDGAFYTTASWTGFPFVQGKVLRITTSGYVSVLHSMADDGSQGGNLQGLCLGSDGWLYGLSYSGGAGYGCVYRVSLAGDYQQLYRFPRHGRTGLFPQGALVEGPPGHFYGTCRLGGPERAGTIFHVRPGGSVGLLQAFLPSAGHGQYPSCGLRRGPLGTFVGTTEFGGAFGSGTIYRLSLR